jgi:hypothetical protein
MHLIIKPHRPIADSNMHKPVSGAGAREQHDLLKRGAADDLDRPHVTTPTAAHPT